MNPAVAILQKESAESVGKIFVFQARKEFRNLEKWMFEEETLNMPLHEVEQGQIQKMYEVMRLLLQAHIDARGDGDVGRAVEVVTREGERIESYTHKRLHTHHHQTVFGEVCIKRMGYGGRGKESIHPKDEFLQLPQKSFSYELQRQLVKASVQGPFDEAKERIEESTSARISKRSVGDILKEASADFDNFYKQRIPPSDAKTGSILVGAIDCKGIPMVKEGKAEVKVRQKKGEKANKKKMATVAAVFTQRPYYRTPEEVVKSLFEPKLRIVGKEEERHKPEYKRVLGKS
ncbi:MAG: hypothetical protein AB1422_14490 [bacterium]